MSIDMSAQAPSDARVKQQIRKRFSEGTIHLGGSSTSKKREGLIWHYYYWRHFTLTKKDPASGLTGKIKSALVYEKINGKYVFHNYATITTEVVGKKPLNKTEVISYLKANLSDFLGSTYNDIVGNMPIISIPDGTKFNWESPDMVTFNVKAVYTKKVSNSTVEKAEHIYETMLFKDANTGKWNRILASEIEGQKRTLSKGSFSSSMKTLQELDEAKASAAAMSSLPAVATPPVFKSDKQLFYYIHDRLMASQPQEAKAHLYKVLSKSSFQNGSTLKQYTQMWFDKLIQNLKSYQYTFCQYPQVKDEQSGAIYFYNKDKSKFVRMTALQENGTWKLKVIDYYPPSQDLINRLAKTRGNCTEKPDLSVKEKIGYKIGNMVDVKTRYGVETGEIIKKDTSFDNRFFVKLQNGSSLWVNDDQMKPSSSKPTNLGIGAHVGIRTRSGVFWGKIIKQTGDKSLIKLDKSGYQDMWIPTSELVTE